VEEENEEDTLGTVAATRIVPPTAGRKELAHKAQEMDAEVVRSPVGYPGKLGDCEVGSVGIVGYPYGSRDQEAVLILAPNGVVQSRSSQSFTRVGSSSRARTLHE
jgi:hypothetical protein